MKTLVKHISCDYKCKFNSATCNSNRKNGIMTNVNFIVKKMVRLKKIIVGILANVFVSIIGT